MIYYFQVFDILNINRMQTGIDMYGQGRYPFYLEPAVIIVISDGGKLTTQASVQGELILPMHSSVPGYELTREPFRLGIAYYHSLFFFCNTKISTHGPTFDLRFYSTERRNYVLNLESSEVKLLKHVQYLFFLI